MSDQKENQEDKVVIFVDDEIDVLMALKAQMKKNFGTQFRYEIAIDANEAWDIIREVLDEGLEIFMIVSDWLMPGLKGDEFLKQVHLEFPDIKKVIISGQSNESSIKQLKEEIGLHSFIRKPWTEKELVEVVTS